MKKLFPLANKETRSLFVHPSICQAWEIGTEHEGYGPEHETSFLKPGLIPNLAKLCKPDNVYFTVTQEPNPDTMAIDELLIGIKDKEGFWHNLTLSNLEVKLERLNAAQWGIDGVVSVPVDENLTCRYDGTYIHLGETKVINVPIKLRYDRATRALSFSSPISYDVEGMELLGMVLDIDWRDAKSI